MTLLGQNQIPESEPRFKVNCFIRHRTNVCEVQYLKILASLLDCQIDTKSGENCMLATKKSAPKINKIG